MEAADDLENNLRLFAMRKAAEASKEFSDLKSRVVVSVHSGPNRHCPMHGKNGNYQAPSRKEMAKELRSMYSREARERSYEHQSRGGHVTSRSSATTTTTSRSQSLEPGINSQIYGNSLPRRFSSASPSIQTTSKTFINSSSNHRYGSSENFTANNPHPPVKKDTFSPKVDFKTTLRQFNPKDDERSRHGFEGGGGGGTSSSRASSAASGNVRPDGELMDYHDSNSYFTQQLTLLNPYAVNPRRGMVLSESSGPASLPIMSSSSSSRPKSRLKLELSSSRPSTPLSMKSPTSSRPQSPRRVEFADEVFFNFNNGHHQVGHHAYQRSSSTDLNPIVKKPILRHVNSETNTASNNYRNGGGGAGNGRPTTPMNLIDQFQASQKHGAEPLSPLVIEHTNLDNTASTKNNLKNYQHHGSSNNKSSSGGGNGNNHNNNNNTAPPAAVSDLDQDLANQRKISQNEDSLVQIYIPPSTTTTITSGSTSKETSTTESEDDDDTISAGSDAEELEYSRAPSRCDLLSLEAAEDTARNLLQSSEAIENGGSEEANAALKKKSEIRRTFSAEVSSRKVPPKLSDWNRSQSFPPPKNTEAASEDVEFNGLQKSNSGLNESEVSIPTKECKYSPFLNSKSTDSHNQ